MGKGSRRRPTDLKKYDENYDKIFGDSKPETGGRWIMDDETGKLVPEDEYMPKHAPTSEYPMVFFKGEGWPTKKIKKKNELRKNLEKDPYYTSMKDKRDRLGENIERQREMVKKMEMDGNTDID